MNLRRLLVVPVLGASLLMWSAMGLTQDAASQPGASAGKQESSGSQLSAKDKAFIMKAAKGGMEEVELGQMVAEKGQSDEVKQFAQRMVQDHSKANDELKSLAQQKGVALPGDTGAEGKALKAKLEKLSGAELDKAYMRNMVLDHNKDVHEFQTASKMAKDNDVKAFAEKTLPTLQDHLKQAKDVAAKTGATSNKKSSETASQ
jgi:putative membrane protein